MLLEWGVAWEDVLPALELVDSIKDLQQALSTPSDWLKRFAKANESFAKQMAIAYLRPKLEPLLLQHHLVWADVMPVLKMIDTVQELKQACAEPDLFMLELTTAADPAASTAPS